MCERLEQLNDPLAQVLTSVSLVYHDIFNVPADPQVANKLLLNKERACTDYPSLSDIFNDDDLVYVLQSREKFIEALLKLLFSRVADYG